jgi:pimeloyl-ACP methyl ester carboxylesterase
MATLQVPGARLHYEQRGEGPETIVFAHGLLFSGRMFDGQVEVLRENYRCVAFDFRGQGKSEVTRRGYDMDTLAEDAAALIEALGCAPCHLVGLSMGGFVGLRLAIRRPELLRTLVLISTSADPDSAGIVAGYRRMAFVTRWLGPRIVARRVERIIFGEPFLNDPSREAERESWMRRIMANGRIGMARAALGVIDREGVRDLLERIAVPTLILVGERDVATPPSKSERMHTRIPGSKLVVIPGAGHTLTVEDPGAVNAALAEFGFDVRSEAPLDGARRKS